MYAHVKLLHVIRVVIFVSKRDCERVSPAMLLAGSRHCERDKIPADPDFGFSKAPVGVP